MTTLLADVGGTNTRCALLVDDGGIVATRVMQNNHYDSLHDALKTYLIDEVDNRDPVDSAAIAVAAPVTGDQVRMTNRVWHFSRTELRDQLGLNRLEVVNDFTAQAAALPFLAPDELVRIGNGKAEDNAAMAILGPGTGLGVSALIPKNGGWSIISGEGGHVTLAASTRREAEVIALLRERFGHCSAERVLSGPGLSALYDVLTTESGGTADNVMPIEVTARASEGEPVARETMEHFFNFLGIVASDLALTFDAHAGVYLAGGILPAVKDAFLASTFRQRFENKGRYRQYLEKIPTVLIVARTPALTGLSALITDRL